MAVMVKFPIYGENEEIFWFDLRGKFMGKMKIYGENENLWGKFMGKIYGENFWLKFMVKSAIRNNDHYRPSSALWR